MNNENRIELSTDHLTEEELLAKFKELSKFTSVTPPNGSFDELDEPRGVETAMTFKDGKIQTHQQLPSVTRPLGNGTTVTFKGCKGSATWITPRIEAALIDLAAAFDMSNSGFDMKTITLKKAK